MFTNSGFIEKFVWYSYKCQLFRASYECNLPMGLLNTVCRRYIRALVIRRLDTIDLLSIYRLYLQLQMCFWCTFNLLDPVYLVFILPWTLEFQRRNSFQGGRNVTLGFSNSESRTQDDTFMNSWALLYWFYRLNFEIGRFVLYIFYENYCF